SVSLYPSQTRELPILNANAYAFLHELVNGLIGYPDPDTVHDRKPDLESRCLRAALGIARTLFSIGVVARFADLPVVSAPLPPRRGYFEHHRLTLRWMLREAARLEDKSADHIDRSGTEWRPFYPDDIAWLFNECGVFSFAQGQCYDAHAM